MPELPEVEIVRQSLNKKILEKKVKKVLVRNRNLRFKIPPNFEIFLREKKIIRVKRFAKYLIFKLSDNSNILLHLGMSGTIHLIKNKDKNFLTNTSFYSSPQLPHKHNHVEISFRNLKLIYNDPRRFGFFQIIRNNDLLKKRFFNFGPEPFDSQFNEEYIYLYCKNKIKSIKDLLLDQNFVSGIGNIYASEILFYCKINPSVKVNLLKKKELKKIIVNSRKVLLNAIKKGGSSIRDFKNISGYKGNFQKHFRVYEREGLNCRRVKCKGIIEKKFFSNRSTFFCNICQK